MHPHVPPKDFALAPYTLHTLPRADELLHAPPHANNILHAPPRADYIFHVPPRARSAPVDVGPR